MAAGVTRNGCRSWCKRLCGLWRGQGSCGVSYNNARLTDGVLAGEAVAGQHSLNTGNEVIHGDGGGEVLGNALLPAGREGKGSGR
jgi:hypothetical protein